MRGGRLSKRGSYFFVLDAFIASAILVLTVVMVFSLFVGPARSEQSFATASDYLSFISTTEIRDFHHVNITAMREDGNITDPTVTIAQQLLILFNRTPTADYCIQCERLINTTLGSLPRNTAVNISLHTKTKNESYYLHNTTDVRSLDTHVVTKSIEYALINDTALYGPVAIVMEVWI